MTRRRFIAATAAAAFVLAGCSALSGVRPLDGGAPALVTGAGRHMGLTPDQATASLGALFGLARNSLSPADWSRLERALPGVGGLVATGATVGGFPSASLSSMKSVTDALRPLAIDPSQVAALTGYVTGTLGAGGASGVASQLSKVWR